jgi:hypothetical protein
MWSPNNPFLYDIMALEEPEQQPGTSATPQLQQTAAAAATVPVQPGGVGNVKLPDFWPHAPAMWFARAECRFEMLNIAGERTRFCCVADAMPYETLRLVADLVASPPMEQPYTLLKERLLLAHAMTATQRAEKLFSLPSLGGRRPSDLLAAMYEFCPPGEETTELFKALFLTRLPPEIRVLLEPREHKDLKQMATKADQLWLTLDARQRAATTAAVQPDSLAEEDQQEPVAAVFRQQKFKSKQKQHQDSKQAATAPPTAQVAGGGGSGNGAKKSVALTICWKHAKFGSKAFSCADPAACQWPEH